MPLGQKRPHRGVEVENENQETTRSKKIQGESDSTEEMRLPELVSKQLANIRTMRAAKTAPVDTQGCHKCHDVNADPKTQRYQILLALMLSSQTKDEVTHAAMMRLRQHGCSVSEILKTSEAVVGELIKPVSFWKTKAINIKKATQVCYEKFDSDIPNSFDGLCSLSGVGPKMSILAMMCAWDDKAAGIAVDTHVHRISNRLEWVKKANNPEATRAQLEKLFPVSLWPELNHLLVGFGQEVCRPVNPDCQRCLNVDICPVGKKSLRSNKKN